MLFWLPTKALLSRRFLNKTCRVNSRKAAWARSISDSEPRTQEILHETVLRPRRLLDGRAYRAARDRAKIRHGQSGPAPAPDRKRRGLLQDQPQGLCARTQARRRPGSD